MTKTPLRMLMAIIGALALLLSACGGDDDLPNASGGGSGEESSGETTEVSLRLNFQTDASAAPFYLAAAKGYYEEAGLDVTIGPGTGSLVTAQTVGAGQDEIGYITSDAAIQAVSNEAALQIVAPLQRTYPAAVVYHPGTTVESLDDLVDLKIFTNQNHPQPVVLRAMVAADGGDPEELDLQSTEVPAWPGLYRDTENGAVLARPGLQNVTFKEIDDVQMTTYAELGLEFYGNTIVVNTEWAEGNAELVKGFVEATTKAWEESIADPEAAVDALLEAQPDVGEREVLLGMLEGTLDLTGDPGDGATEIEPFDEERFQTQVDFMAEYMELQDPKPATDYFTTEYSG